MLWYLKHISSVGDIAFVVTCIVALGWRYKFCRNVIYKILKSLENYGLIVWSIGSQTTISKMHEAASLDLMDQYQVGRPPVKLHQGCLSHALWIWGWQFVHLFLVLVKVWWYLCCCLGFFVVNIFFFSVSRGRLCVLLMIVKLVIEGRTTWLGTFYYMKGRHSTALLWTATLSSLCKAIWKDTLRRFTTAVPLPLLTKVTNNMCVQRLAVERFSDFLHS